MSPFPVPLVCPRCRAAVHAEGEAYACRPCGASYPIVAGIPDFRVSPDPWIGLADDRAKATRLEETTRGLGFAETVRAYWDMTPDTPRELAAHFVAHVLRAEVRSREWLDALALGDGGDRTAWLDLGCGTADLAAAAGPARTVVGIDVALRWLVAARKRLAERGVPVHLVCANAERLPFPAESFRVVLSLGMLEHCADKSAVLDEARRVLRAGGVAHLRTVNRFTVLSEPHVGLVGIGWLPRRWADAYARWRRRGGYEHHHPIGERELRRGLRRAGFADVRVRAARSLPTEVDTMGRWGRRLVPVYEALRAAPGVSGLLGLVAPILEARGRAA